VVSGYLYGAKRATGIPASTIVAEHLRPEFDPPQRQTAVPNPSPLTKRYARLAEPLDTKVNILLTKKLGYIFGRFFYFPKRKSASGGGEDVGDIRRFEEECQIHLT